MKEKDRETLAMEMVQKRIESIEMPVGIAWRKAYDKATGCVFVQFFSRDYEFQSAIKVSPTGHLLSFLASGRWESLSAENLFRYLFDITLIIMLGERQGDSRRRWSDLYEKHAISAKHFVPAEVTNEQGDD